MAKRIRALIRTSLIKFTSLAVILAACGTPAAAPLDPGNGDDDDDDIDDGPDPIYQEVACPAFSLAASSGMPLELIAIGELPSEFESPFAGHLMTAEDDTAGFAHIVPSEAGDLELLVPLHPAEPVAGGDVTMMLTDGTVACAAVEFAIEPLPEADGEFAAVVDLLQVILSEQATLLETTPEALRTTPFEDLARAHWPLALAQAVLDDPDNDESLRAIADGALGSDVLDLLDRLLTRTDLRSSLEAPAADPAEVSSLAASNQMASNQCTVANVGSNASLLDSCMATAAEVKRSTEGISKAVADDIGKAIAVAGKLGLPAADALERAFSILFWYIYNERDKIAGTYPSAFTSMTVDVDKPTFMEDEDGQGSVTNATVYATSTGWDAVQALTDAIDEGLALAKEGVKFGEVPKGDDFAEEIGNLFKTRLGDLPLDALNIPADLFGPVTVTDPAWIQARVAVGDAIALAAATTYEPKNAGTATLSVRTKDGSFGGAQIAQQVDVTVETIQLDFDPDVEFVTPGESKELTLTVHQSAFPDKVELIEGMERQGSVTMTYNGEAKYTVTYTAPQEPDPSKTDLIAVRHTATSGARGAPDAPERTATAELRFGRVTISPRAGCVDPESTKLFTAAVQGSENQDVEWDASHGSIDDNGLYTAPSETPADGQATIMATSVENPALVDAVTIRIGCTCTFSVSLAGQHEMDTPGYHLEYNAYEEYEGASDVITRLTVEEIDGIGDNDIEIRLDFRELANTPGVYSTAFWGSFSMQAPDLGFSSEGFQPILEVVEYIPGRILVVEIHGTVGVSRQVGETDFEIRPEPFDLSLSIDVPGDWDPTGPGAFGHGFVCVPEQPDP